jgi:SAM-dependent methyltransferase
MILEQPKVQTPEIAEAWEHFDARAYLNEYYADIEAENIAFLNYFVRVFQDLPVEARNTFKLLDFGSGPTIYALITAAAKVHEIHVCDYLEPNREELRLWLSDDPKAFNWRAFIAASLEMETGVQPSDLEVTEREAEIRDRTTKVMYCDASVLPPIAGMTAAYDMLVSNSCAEAATNDYREWRRYVANIAALLKPGGRIAMSAVKGADFGSVESSEADGSLYFPTVKIFEADLVNVLTEVGFQPHTISVESVSADRPSRKYQGIMFATAIKG